MLCMGIPDYLKDDHTAHGKLAILEKHQIDLRKNYLSTTNDNGLNPDTLGVRFGLKEHSTQAASLILTDKEEGEDNPNKPLLFSRRKTSRSCSCVNDVQHLTTIEANVGKILELLEDNVLKEQRKAEWRMLGALIDRVLLIILIIAASTTTLYIYVIASPLNRGKSFQ